MGRGWHAAAAVDRTGLVVGRGREDEIDTRRYLCVNNKPVDA